MIQDCASFTRAALVQTKGGFSCAMVTLVQVAWLHVSTMARHSGQQNMIMDKEHKSQWQAYK